MHTSYLLLALVAVTSAFALPQSALPQHWVNATVPREPRLPIAAATSNDDGIVIAPITIGARELTR